MARSYREKLSHLVYVLLVLAIVGSLCWYFKNVLVYIAMALMVTLLALPFRRLYGRIHIGKHELPDWLCAVMAILTEFIFLSILSYLLVPLFKDVTRDISQANLNDLTKVFDAPFASINSLVGDLLAGIEQDFRIENVIFGKVQQMMDAGALSNAVGGVTSFFVNMGVTVFAVIFISFFFIKTPSLFENIVRTITKEDKKDKVHESVHEIRKLLTRYFQGLTVEVAGVWLINFIGLWAIARMGFKYSVSIAFLVGLLNVVPYIGPLIGCVLSVSLSLIIHYTSGGAFGLDVGLMPFVFIVLGIGVFAQIIDNYVFQPVIYSTSVQAHPLEIFIVFLIAGQLGGMFGMIIAIPFYTVLRVIAKEFFSDIRAVRKLTLDEEKK